MIHRIRLLLFATLTATGALAFAQADSYPSKPIRLIVPYTPGGSADLSARLLAEALAKRWGQPVLVENKAGAGTILGTNEVATAAPDGHTLLLIPTQFAAVPSMYAKVPYDTRTAFQHVAMVASLTNVLVVNAKLGAATAADVVRLARSGAGSLNYASGGTGSSQYFTVEQFKQAAGIPLTHVPYKGSAPAEADVAAGHVALTITPIVSVMPFIKSAHVVPLAVTSASRSSLLPDVPTFAEAGFPGVNYVAWLGVSAPAGTPRAIVDKLNQAINEIMSEPAVKQRLRGVGLDPVAAISPEQFRAVIERDTEELAKILKKAGYKEE